MRKLIRNNIICELNRNGKWLCNDKPLQNKINKMTELILFDISPSDGEPLEIIFNSIKKMINPTKTINTEVLKPIKGVTY